MRSVWLQAVWFHLMVIYLVHWRFWSVYHCIFRRCAPRQILVVVWSKQKMVPKKKKFEVRQLKKQYHRQCHARHFRKRKKCHRQCQMEYLSCSLAAKKSASMGMIFADLPLSYGAACFRWIKCHLNLRVKAHHIYKVQATTSVKIINNIFSF